MSKVGEYYRELEEMGIDERDIRRAVKLKKVIDMTREQLEDRRVKKQEKKELNSPLYRGEKK